MRAITVRQPWAWAIIHGSKDVENRSRNIAGSYRGPVAIHAGLAITPWSDWSDEMLRAHRSADPAYILGHVIGIVDLVGVHVGSISQTTTHRGGPVCFDDTTPIGQPCSPWAMPHHHHLVLANPRPLPEPIPYRGALGLWTLPDDVLNLH